MNKIRIAFISLGLGNGGRERRLVELIKGLDELGLYDIHLILIGSEIDYPDIFTTSTTLHIGDVAIGRYNSYKRVFDLLKMIQPKIVHNWNDSWNIQLACVKGEVLLRYKLITGFLADGNPIKKIHQKLSTRISYIFSHAIISNSIAGIIAKKAPKNKSHVIYNGFSFKRFEKFDSYDASVIKKELGIPLNNVIVSKFARFELAKDWDMFLDLVQILNRSKEGITFLAVGKGQFLNHYKQLAQSKGIQNIIFTGFRTDIDKLLYISDVTLTFANSTIHAEGISNSIMESMAAGKPVIATYGGGTSEIIENEVNSYIVEPKDVNGAANKLSRLLEDKALYSIISTNAANTVKTKFSLDNMTQRYVNIYNEILA